MMIDRNDVLYVLTVSGDLAGYYDSRNGEGTWDELTSKGKLTISRSVERALDGFMEDWSVAFDTGIDDSGVEAPWRPTCETCGEHYSDSWGGSNQYCMCPDCFEEAVKSGDTG